MRSLLTALLLIVSFALGGVTQYVTAKPHREGEGVPSLSSQTGYDCPTEDSCTVDYSHGKWTVTEVTP